MILNKKSNIYFKTLTTILILFFLFTFEIRKTNSSTGFLLFGGPVESEQECPAIYSTVYWTGPPKILPVMQTIESRARAYAVFGGFIEIGQYGLGTALPIPFPCVQSWYPYSQNGIGYLPILQGTAPPG